MIKIRAIAMLLLSIMMLGCVSHKQAMYLFVRERDYEIGRHISEVPLGAPTEIKPINEDTSEYVYNYYDAACRFSYAVDNKTKRVLSWRFLGEPDMCYVRFGGV